MRAHLTVRRYCAAIVLAACALVAVLARTIDLSLVVRHPLTFGLLSAGLLLGEMLPVTVPRSEGDERIGLSTSYALALLLVGGIGPALIGQGIASALEDVVSGKPGWRIRFNAAQHTLSLGAAWLAMRALPVSGLGSLRPFTGAELPAVLLGGAVYVVVNTVLVGAAVALHRKVAILPFLLRDFWFVLATSCVLLVLAPIVVASAAYSPALLPLFTAPMLLIYTAGRQVARGEHAARHDALTGLSNRSAFQTIVEREARDGGDPFGVLLLDLDRFKEVNDTLGHDYGDLLLEQVAARLREQSGGHQLARLGGDEFAILALGCGADASLALASRIADALRAPFELDEVVLDTQASIGVAVYPAHGADAKSLLQRADVAMYQAKQARADVTLYAQDQDHHSPAKLALTGDLRSAIESDEIVVFYQPELDLATEMVTAVEALVRWQHPELGLLAPGSFLDIALHTNLIKPLTQKVLGIALAQVAEWSSLGLELTVAVNVSTRVLVDHEFTDQVLGALDRAGLPARALKLEVTETGLMEEPETARAVLAELDRHGIEISIDDFGTGYSSLQYLATLPVSEVKIDRSFVSRMATHADDAIIVSSTIELAHHLGMRAIAEGVEQLDLLPALRALRCDVVQGYGLSRPIPGDEATRWLQDYQQQLLRRAA